MAAARTIGAAAGWLRRRRSHRKLLIPMMLYSIECMARAAEHSSYEEVAGQRRQSEEYREGYAEARRAFLIGQAVRDRRLALGLSQVELAAGAGMTQPALSRLEAGGVVPTIPLLERITAALDAELIVEIAPHAA
jgi:ribosome-binding protein aMBF1 (putative translation factor)